MKNPYVCIVIVFDSLFRNNVMSRTKDLFFDALADAMQPTEAELEMEYWYTLNERKELYLAHLQRQVEELPDSYFFSQEYADWMQSHYQEIAKTQAELFVAKRKEGKPSIDMDFDIPERTEDLNHQKRNERFDENFF